MLLRKFTAVYCIILSAAYGTASAQVELPLAKTLINMGVDLKNNKVPDGYHVTANDTVKVFSTNKIDGHEMGGWKLYGSITSNDRNFISTVYTYPLFSMLDSVENTRYAIGHNLGVVEIPEDGGYFITGRPNYMHNNYVSQLLSRNQKTYNFEKKAHTHYYVNQGALDMFNADTVIYIPLNIPILYNSPTYIHRSMQYNHMQAYVIHRHNRGFFILFCFTNDIGQRDFDKHFKAMQQIFRYKDDE